MHSSKYWLGGGSHQSRGQPQDGQEGPGRGEGGVFAHSRFLPHLHVGGGQVVGQRLWHHGLPLFAQCDVAPAGTSVGLWSEAATEAAETSSESAERLSSPHQLHVDGREVCGRLAAVLVHVGDVLGQTQIGVGVRLVLDQPQQVETREQGGRQLDVLLDALARVVAAVGRVGGREDGAAGVQRGHDAGLGEEEEDEEEE